MAAPDYLDLSKQAYEASTAYIDGNFRKDWDYALRAFRNEHAQDSKYHSEEYKARSRIFFPKTRSIIRKNESAAMHAMFANRETVNVDPADPDNIMNVAGAACMKEVLEFRLTRTIPAYEIYLGGIQDAQTTGAVVSYQYWDYERKADGRVVKDKPCIELRPVENIRLDAGASWINTVESTPYWCDIVPMYVCDVKGMMEQKDEKTGRPKWKKFEDDIIALARPDSMDATRKARLGNIEDPHDKEQKIKHFDIVWVLRWFMRDSQGSDLTYYTLGTERLLTEVKPIDEVYFHGRRPYSMGYAVLETHKALKTGLPVLTRSLQQATNNIGNARFDNVNFVLYKRWLVARGRQVDVQSLVRAVPGGVTLMTDPKTDVQESNWPDVTSSSFVEQDRFQAAFDDLAGNFSPSTKVANNAVNDTLGGSRMAAQGAGMMTDYLIRTVNETWWEPVLRQMALLEAHYETNEVVLGICGAKAQLFPRFGMSRITDDLLMQDVLINVDAATGDPQARFQKFMMATQAALQIRASAPPGTNVEEMTKEIYANAGYRDGARFFKRGEDPRLLKAMQAIQQLQGMVKGKQLELQANQQTEAAKIQSNERIKAAELQVDRARISGDLQIRQAELAVESQRLELEKLKLQLEAAIAEREAQSMDKELPYRVAEMQASLEQAQMKLEGERQKLVGLAVKIAHESEKAKMELATMQDAHDNEGKISQVADGVGQAMQSVAQQVEEIKSNLSSSTGGLSEQVDALKKGMGAIAGVIMSPKKKAVAFKLKKKDGKRTSAVVVHHDDGTTEEISVN